MYSPGVHFSCGPPLLTMIHQQYGQDRDDKRYGHSGADDGTRRQCGLASFNTRFRVKKHLTGEGGRRQ